MSNLFGDENVRVPNVMGAKSSGNHLIAMVFDITYILCMEDGASTHI